MKTVLEVLKATTTFLEQKQMENARREAEDLISGSLGISRMQLYLDFERPLNDKELDLAREYLRRRLTGEPYGYIVGKQEFFHCEFFLNSAVLIPRQETEILADKIASALKTENLQGKKFLDLCCGSGCLGLSLKNALPDLEMTLSDISSEALAVAKENGFLNELKVNYVQGDLLEGVKGQLFDYVVCNPPYISEVAYAELSPEVKNFEPKRALLAGETGLEIYQRLAEELPTVLRSGGQVWFEIGFDQGETVPALFHTPCWKRKIISKDWAGHDRFFFLEIE